MKKRLVQIIILISISMPSGIFALHSDPNNIEAGDEISFNVPLENQDGGASPIENVRAVVSGFPAWLDIDVEGSLTGPIAIYPGEAVTYTIFFKINSGYNPNNPAGAVIIDLLSDSTSFIPASLTWTFTTDNGFKTVRGSCVANDGVSCGTYISPDTLPPVTYLEFDGPLYEPDSGTILLATSTLIYCVGADTYENNADISRASVTGYSIGSLPGSFDSLNFSTQPVTLAEGPHILYFASRDNAGNTEVIKSSAIYVDGTDPGTPLNPKIEGAGVSPWKNVKEYYLSWTNPADVSGIAGVFAKFGLEKPVSNDEGDFYIAVDSVVYSTVALINGQNAVWLWLEDNVGNADPSTAVQIVLRYDDIAPISSASAPAISSSSVIPINFNSSDEGAPDTGSGPDFTALRYKHESDLNYSSSAYVLSGSSGTFDFSVERTGVSVEGEWKFYTQAWDKAGNSELQPVSTTIAKASTFLDTTAPVISNVRSTILSPYSARIDWTTDDETTGIIQYDTRSPIRDTGYKIEDSALVKTHSMTLYGLPSPATIYFKMTASNRSGLQTASVIGSFSTPIKGKKRGR